ncbi:MAG: DinB family protein [Acidobacteriota bacterium]|nr:DinB family protein [Acidobacteriota bacterium]
MLRRSLLSLSPLALLRANAAATVCPSYFAKGLLARWTSSREYTLAVFDKMPEEQLAFRPTPEQWTFAQQFTHIADGSLLIAAPLHGDKAVYTGAAPRQLARAELRQHLEHSFTYVAEAIQRLPDDAAGEQRIEFLGGEKLLKRELCYRLLDHVAHHRGQAIVYLRLKGITPPEYPG